MISTAVRTWPEDSSQDAADVLPMTPALAGLLPRGGLRRGSVVVLDEPGALLLALAAGVSAAGGWCALVGLAECGALAAAEAGVDLDRLLLVERPGPRWAQVAAALLDGVELVAVRPPAPPSGSAARRLAAVARQHGGVLLVVGEHGAGWEGAGLRLGVAESAWVGLGDGHGHLWGRRTQVVAAGREVGGRPRVARVWLPGPDGRAHGMDLAEDLRPVGRPADAPSEAGSVA